MRSRAIAGGLACLLMACVVTGAGPKAPSEQLLASRQRLARATTLRVLERCGPTGQGAIEYWFRLPDLFRVDYRNGTNVYGARKRLVRVSVERSRTEETLSEPFPVEIRPPRVFDPFFTRQATPLDGDEAAELDTRTIAGRKVRAWYTYASGSLSVVVNGYDPRTFLPLVSVVDGRETTEESYYEVVSVDDELPAHLFSLPAVSK